MPQKLYVLFLLLFSLNFGTAQENDNITTDIELKTQQNNLVSISGVCHNNSSEIQNLNYSLNVQKISNTGSKSKNSQSGTFTIKPNENKTLSTTTINFEAKDQTRVVLTVFNSMKIQVAQQQKLLTIKDIIKN
ncbi:curli-like amyloid fiber formation chaperone CsgH [Maribacter dokdonensis]|uniref:curli-like amyloid fiber formation chaperone CsgH n=1 Tax=Maribacter dokdonensis TaxID=320912 RepID=UPI002AB31848|nr:curli-like amyloid fiber formation chaperone CsgH [Maribacter dokdonensis]